MADVLEAGGGREQTVEQTTLNETMVSSASLTEDWRKRKEEDERGGRQQQLAVVLSQPREGDGGISLPASAFPPHLFSTAFSSWVYPSLTLPPLRLKVLHSISSLLEFFHQL